MTNLTENTQRSERDYAWLFAAAVALDPARARVECGWLLPERISTMPVKVFWQKILAGETLAEASAAAGGNMHADLLLWMSRIPNYTEAQEYAKVIEQKAYFVELSEKIGKVAQAISSGDGVLVDQALEKLTLTARGVGGKDMQHISEWAELALETIEARMKREEVPVIKTGIRDLDERIEGLDNNEGTLILLCGEPGAGKTILWSQMCFHMATQKPGGLFSLEMKSRRMMYRAFSTMTEISSWKMRKGFVNQNELNLLADRAAGLINLPLYVADPGHMDTSTLHTTLYRYKRDYGLEWYGLDYLTLLRDDQQLKKWERAEVLSQRLLQINRDLNLASVVIHTLNGKGEISGGMGTQYDADVICTLVNDPDTGCPPGMEAKKLTFQKIRDSEAGLSAIPLLKVVDRPLFKNANEKTEKLNGKNGRFKDEREILEFHK